MAEFFDEPTWRQCIIKPDWYVELYPELAAMRERWEAGDDADTNRMKREVRGFFRSALQSGRLALGKNGPDFDAERRPIDTVVIHHTSAAPGYDLGYMNATQLLNVYVPYFNNPTDEADSALKGQPIWSNHVRDGKPVFYLYHWLMRMDGRFERLLKDHEIGWHAANWDVNCRSVGICLDNDYEAQDPSPKLVQKLGRFISENYPQILPEQVVGHSEVSLRQRATVCPGSGFIDSWKLQLQAAMG